MEIYGAIHENIESQVRTSIDKLTNVIGGKRKRLNINAWKDFAVGDYFSAINTGNILSRDIVDGSGSTPLLLQAVLIMVWRLTLMLPTMK